MNEREEWMEKFNSSYEMMQRIYVYETELEKLAKKQKKLNGNGIYFVMMIAIGVILFLIGLQIEKIIPALGITCAVFTLLAALIAPKVITTIIAKNIGNEIQGRQYVLEQAKNAPVLSWLPMKYRDSYSYSCLATYFEDMRADNLKEAIELFELECHRARVEMNSLRR